MHIFGGDIDCLSFAHRPTLPAEQRNSFIMQKCPIKLIKWYFYNAQNRRRTFVSCDLAEKCFKQYCFVCILSVIQKHVYYDYKQTKKTTKMLERKMLWAGISPINKNRKRWKKMWRRRKTQDTPPIWMASSAKNGSHRKTIAWFMLLSEWFRLADNGAKGFSTHIRNLTDRLAIEIGCKFFENSFGLLLELIHKVFVDPNKTQRGKLLNAHQ